MPIGTTGGGGGGGKALIMPQFVTANNLLQLKASNSIAYLANTSDFYTALGRDFSEYPFEVATLAQAGNTSEQTIVDTGTGKEGVLTHVICAGLSAAGTATIRVSIDGVVHVFSRNLLLGTRLFSIGDFENYAASTTVSASTGIASGLSNGFSTTQVLTMITPTDSASRGLPIGMAFKDSLKVTVQGSVNFLAGSASNKSVAAWLDYLPMGVF